MNIKNFFIILPLFYLKVTSGPVITDSIDISSESEDDFYSEIEYVDLLNEEIHMVDIFSDEENIVTEVINTSEEEEVKN